MGSKTVKHLALPQLLTISLVHLDLPKSVLLFPYLHLQLLLLLLSHLLSLQKHILVMRST